MYKINDELYGEYSVEAVIFELINTDIFKRLKKVHQNGGIFLVNPGRNVKRYEHSIGTMLLSLKFQRTLEEQIKCLLHDISHSAFSHVIDYVLGYREENWHETVQSKFIEKEELQNIFQKYNLNLRKIMETHCNLLDAEIPDLSFDRLDYTLRDMLNQKVINKNDIENFLKHLVVFEDKLCIDSVSGGKWIYELYLKETEFFKSPLNMYANSMLTKLFSNALKEKIISLSDFEMTDDIIIEKIENSHRKKDLEKIKDKKDFCKFSISESKLNIKNRYIDPHILIDGKVYRLSELGGNTKNIF